MLAIVFPECRYRAIEERYASWQCELVLRRENPDAIWIKVDPHAEVSAILGALEADFVLVITTPLILPTRNLCTYLTEALESDSADASVPVLNVSTASIQHEPPSEVYLTLRQLEEVASGYSTRSPEVICTDWKDDDPTVFLARASYLRSHGGPLEKTLRGARVAVARRAYVHRFAAHRAQVRLDLLDRVSVEAKAILEFGCGEGGLGEALKRRQSCRVVGVELDSEAVRVARGRLDAVHEGDVREVVEQLNEKFDFIVGGDILEHLDEPWTFLDSLRRIARPGAHLLLSLPNVSSWPIVADLLQGRFDYVYMGILCAGHVRFFTKQTVRDMLEISGWSEVALTDQDHFPSPELEKLIKALVAGDVPHSAADLMPTGHYVLARSD